MKSELEETLFQSIIGVGLPTPLARCRGNDTHLIPDQLFSFSFLWREEKLAVDIQDQSWIGYSISNAVPIRGYALFLFTPPEIDNGYALATIQRWFETDAGHIPF